MNHPFGLLRAMKKLHPQVYRRLQKATAAIRIDDAIRTDNKTKIRAHLDSGTAEFRVMYDLGRETCCALPLNKMLHTILERLDRKRFAPLIARCNKLMFQDAKEHLKSCAHDCQDYTPSRKKGTRILRHILMRGHLPAGYLLWHDYGTNRTETAQYIRLLQLRVQELEANQESKC